MEKERKINKRMKYICKTEKARKARNVHGFLKCKPFQKKQTMNDNPFRMNIYIVTTFLVTSSKN